MQIENIERTIQPWEWQWNSLYKSWEYSINHDFIMDGVLVGYIMNGQGKQALPFYDNLSNATFGLVDRTFDGKIVVTYYNNTTTLQKPQYEEYVYLKVIPSNEMIPNVDYSNPQAVIEAHNF